MPRPPLSAVEIDRARVELLDAAQRIYEVGGHDAMSFRALASELGWSHAKAYSYFDSKADVIDHLRLRAYRWLRDLLAVEASCYEDPLLALRAVAHAYVEAGRSRPRMYELLYSDRGAMAEQAPPLLHAKLEAIGVAETVIAAIAEDPRHRLRFDPTTAAHLFWIAAHGVVSLDNGGFLVVGRSAEDLIAPLFDVVQSGSTEET